MEEMWLFIDPPTSKIISVTCWCGSKNHLINYKKMKNCETVYVGKRDKIVKKSLTVSNKHLRLVIIAGWRYDNLRRCQMRNHKSFSVSPPGTVNPHESVKEREVCVCVCQPGGRQNRTGV